MIRALLLASGLLGASTSAVGARPLDVYWIDVEGGAATLIVTPAGESLLIDTGNPGARDAGRIHHVAAEVARLKKIDHVVVTHLHRDHFGGLAELAALIPVGTVWATPIEAAPAQERAQPEVDAYRNAKVETRRTVTAGEEIPLAQAKDAAPLRVRFVSARQDLATPAAFQPNDEVCKDVVEKPVDFSDNANSVALVLDLGRFRFFVGGDLTWNVERRLVCPFDRVGRVDVYQSNHHGLDSGNNPSFVRSLAPRVVVFNNGTRKGGAPAAMQAVKGSPDLQAVYQVHKNLNEGAINTEDAKIANLVEACAGQPIHVSVEPGGDRYSVRVPSTEHSATYATRAP